MAGLQMTPLMELRSRSEVLWRQVQELDVCLAHVNEVTQTAELEAAQYGKTSVSHLESLLGEVEDEFVQVKVEQILLRSIKTGQLETLDPKTIQGNGNEDRHKKEVAKFTRDIEESIATICSGWELFEENQSSLHDILSSCDQEITNLEELYEEVKNNADAEAEYEAAVRRLTEISTRSRDLETVLAAEEKYIKLAEAEVEEVGRQLREQQETQQGLRSMADKRERLTAVQQLAARYYGVTLTDLTGGYLKFHLTNFTHAFETSGKMTEILSPHHDLEITLDPLSLQLLSAKLHPESFSIAEVVSAAKQKSALSSGLSRMDGKRHLTFDQVEFLVMEVRDRIHSHDMKISVVHKAAQSSRYAFRLLDPPYISATIRGNVDALLEAPISWPAPDVPLSLSSLLPSLASSNLSSTHIQKVLAVCNSLEKHIRCDLVRFVEAVEKVTEGVQCR